MSVQEKLDDIDRVAIGKTHIVEEVLGEGTYGIVVRARNRVTGALYAIKKIRLDGFAEGVPATAIREVTLLQDLSHHPNIVKLLEVICREHRVYLVFELLSEDLRAFIRKHRPQPPLKASGSVVPLPIIKNFTRQTLHALWSCHNSRVIHRDLKPGNILVDTAPPSKVNGGGGGKNDPQYIFKLADFGLARTFEMPLVTYTNEVMTLWYRAPEILLGEKHYTPAVDMWSLGCIVAEMLVGHSLFRGDSTQDQLRKVFYVVGTPTEETWPGVTKLPGFKSSFPLYRVAPLATRLPEFDKEAAEFVAFLLQANPKLRPTTTTAMDHPFLASPKE